MFAGIFDVNENHLTLSICPHHRDDFGVRWLCNKKFCLTPPDWAPHKNYQRKGDRGITLAQSKRLYLLTSTLVPVGSRKSRLSIHMHSLVSSFIYSFIHLSLHSFAPPLILQYDHTCVYSFNHWIVCLSNHSFIIWMYCFQPYANVVDCYWEMRISLSPVGYLCQCKMSICKKNRTNLLQFRSIFLMNQYVFDHHNYQYLPIGALPLRFSACCPECINAQALTYFGSYAMLRTEIDMH